MVCHVPQFAVIQVENDGKFSQLTTTWDKPWPAGIPCMIHVNNLVDRDDTPSLKESSLPGLRRYLVCRRSRDTH